MPTCTVLVVVADRESHARGRKSLPWIGHNPQRGPREGEVASGYEIGCSAASDQNDQTVIFEVRRSGFPEERWLSGVRLF